MLSHDVFRTWSTFQDLNHLKASIGVCRESKKESEHNFDPKGVFKGKPSDLVSEDPPP